MKQQQAVITHIVKSQGVTDAQLQAALSSSPITSDYANRLCSSVTSRFETRALDVFLEYQWILVKKLMVLNDKTLCSIAKEHERFTLLYQLNLVYGLSLLLSCLSYKMQMV
jgi:hypothetical protein